MSSGGVVDAFGPGEIFLPPGPHDENDPEDPQFVGPPSQIPDMIGEDLSEIPPGGLEPPEADLPGNSAAQETDSY